MQLSTEQIKAYANYLCREEKTRATQEKYLRDVQISRIWPKANWQRISRRKVAMMGVGYWKRSAFVNNSGKENDVSAVNNQGIITAVHFLIWEVFFSSL